MKRLQASVGCQAGALSQWGRTSAHGGVKAPGPSRAGRMRPRWVVFGAVPSRKGSCWEKTAVAHPARLQSPEFPSQPSAGCRVSQRGGNVPEHSHLLALPGARLHRRTRGSEGPRLRHKISVTVGLSPDQLSMPVAPQGPGSGGPVRRGAPGGPTRPPEPGLLPAGSRGGWQVCRLRIGPQQHVQ